MSEATFMSGTVAPGWEAVQEAFSGNFVGEEVGAGVSVYHRGEKVVDLWGGSFDSERTQPYDDQALQLVFSTTKGITAIAVAKWASRAAWSTHSSKMHTVAGSVIENEKE